MNTDKKEALGEIGPEEGIGSPKQAALRAQAREAQAEAEAEAIDEDEIVDEDEDEDEA